MDGFFLSTGDLVYYILVAIGYVGYIALLQLFRIESQLKVYRKASNLYGDKFNLDLVFFNNFKYFKKNFLYGFLFDMIFFWFFAITLFFIFQAIAPSSNPNYTAIYWVYETLLVVVLILTSISIWYFYGYQKYLKIKGENQNTGFKINKQNTEINLDKEAIDAFEKTVTNKKILKLNEWLNKKVSLNKDEKSLNIVCLFYLKKSVKIIMHAEKNNDNAVDKNYFVSKVNIIIHKNL